MGDQSTIYPATVPAEESTQQYSIQESSTDQESVQGISVLTECVAGPKSIYQTCLQKIDVESIYDNVDKKKNMTRFTALPTKL